MAIATLPIVLAVVLTELAVGGAFLLWFIDRGGRAPSGFLKLVAFVDAGAMAAALALLPSFLVAIWRRRRGSTQDHSTHSVKPWWWSRSSWSSSSSPRSSRHAGCVWR